MKHYISAILGTTLLLTGAIAAVNYTVDPLDIWRGKEGPHPAAVTFARVKKAEDVKRLKPDVIITGTSRANTGLDPREEFFPGLTAYNFALASATINEQRQTLEFAQAVRPLRKAIITLDFFIFNARKLDNKQFDPERLSPEALGPVQSLLGTYGMVLSLDTITASLKHRRALRKADKYPVLLPNGRLLNRDLEAVVKRDGARPMFMLPPNAAEIAVDDFTFNYSDAPGDTTFRHLDAMLDFSRKNNIEVILIISPVHRAYIEALEKVGLKATVAEWKDRIAALNRAAAAKYGAKPYPLWDFATVNSITGEPLPPEGDRTTQMRWFWDSNHYKPELGDIILRKVLGLPGGAQYPDFGRRLD